MTTKRCLTCGEEKELTEFYQSKTPRYNTNICKISSYCKPCDIANKRKRYYANHERELENSKLRKKRYKNVANYYAKYDLSQEDVQAMRDTQNNCCAICKQETKLCVDHNHSTNKVRALLCSSCNKALGFAREDITVLQAMIEYLIKHNKTEQDS